MPEVSNTACSLVAHPWDANAIFETLACRPRSAYALAATAPAAAARRIIPEIAAEALSHSPCTVSTSLVTTSSCQNDNTSNQNNSFSLHWICTFGLLGALGSHSKQHIHTRQIWYREVARHLAWEQGFILTSMRSSLCAWYVGQGSQVPHSVQPRKTNVSEEAVTFRSIRLLFALTKSSFAARITFFSKLTNMSSTSTVRCMACSVASSLSRTRLHLLQMETQPRSRSCA